MSITLSAIPRVTSKAKWAGLTGEITEVVKDFREMMSFLGK